MKKQTTLLLILTTCLLPFLAFSQSKTGDGVMAGKDIAVTETESGQVAGYIHNHTYIYKGIPYAHAERFMAPEKPKPWTGVRSSRTYGPVCPIPPTTQVNDPSEFVYDHDWGYMNENCQVLNIWTQGIKDGKKRPVMVWIHGGGFSAGSSIELPSYEGENISKKGDVVLVSINHRLNALGFLDMSAYGDKYKGSANAGMLDIVAALQWVKANIANFGGDPDNVTIFGQSGGGGKVSTLMAAPSAKGLFAKAIVQSGSYVSAFGDETLAKRLAAGTLAELGLQPNQADSMQKISYERLSDATRKATRKLQEQLKAEGKTGPQNIGWGPILDASFLTAQPNDPASVELSKNVPLLVGTVKNEIFPSAGNAKIREYTMDEAKTYLQKIYGDKTDAYIAAVKETYPNSTNHPSDYIDVDTRFRGGAVKQANAKSAAGGAPVYMYLFAWQSPILDGYYKAIHCIDLCFEFNNIARCEQMTGGSKEAYALADKVSQAWINFARTGNPNAKGLPNWPAYNEKNGATMILDNLSEVKNHPDGKILEIVAAK